MIFNVNENSNVYYIQEVEDERYELIFGDGIFGVKLDNDNFVEASYIITNGESANNINKFAFIGNLKSSSGDTISSGVSIVTTEISSGGGKPIESIDSVKKYAPQIYASQNRAVTAKDYQVRVLSMPTKYGSIAKSYATADGTLDNNSPSSILSCSKTLSLLSGFISYP